MPLKFLTHDKILYTSTTLPCNRNLLKIAKIRLYSVSELVNCLVSNYGTTTVFHKLKLS